MTFRQYLVVMLIGTAVSWTAFWMILTLIDPENAGLTGLSFFYLSLAVATSGTLALIGLVIRAYVVRTTEVLSKQVVHAFREAILLSCMLVVALFLQRQALLTVLNTILLIGVVILLEFFFLAIRDRSRT